MTDDLDSRAYFFGTFSLVTQPPKLQRDGVVVDLGWHALTLLIELVKNAGTVVTKNALMACAWPGRAVDETNLRTHIRALRIALGDDRRAERYIVNVPGRGYVFVASVQRPKLQREDVSDVSLLASGLPLSLERIIGRDAVVQQLAQLATEHRLLTITGSGGIGKTTVAVAAARKAAARFDGFVAFIELTAATSLARAAAAVAAALRIPVPPLDPLPHLARALRETRGLIVIDNCEHLLEAAAMLAEALIDQAPNIHILTTSREPLDASGEWVFHLKPLDIPPVGSSISAQEASSYSAVQLFVERAVAASSFSMTDENAGVVAEITRRLDGMPLTIEFGAVQLPVLGVHGLASELRRRTALSLKGRRTAAPRHQTLAAVLDWSYRLLSPLQQRALCALSVLVGSFSLSDAAAILDPSGGPTEAARMLADLQAKSMLVHEATGYRLLETTRAYALDKLQGSEDYAAVARRHAGLVLQVLGGRREEMPRLRQDVDNLRAAFDWALSPVGDVKLGVTLVRSAVSPWVRLAMVDDCIASLRAVLSLDRGRDEASLRRRLDLLRPLAAVELFASGPGATVQAIWQEILTIANGLNDATWRSEALRGLWMNAIHSWRACDALATAERYGELSMSAVTQERVVADRMVGYALHLIGDHEGARPYLDRIVAAADADQRMINATPFAVDPKITARMRLGLIDWLQGYSDRAAQQVEAAARDAVDRQHAFSLCSALVQGAIPVSLLRGDLEAAERHVRMLAETAERDAFSMFTLIARGAGACIMIRRGAVANGLQELSEALASPPLPALGFFVTPFRAVLAEVLCTVGQVTRGRALIDEALVLSEEGGEWWYKPELIRICAALTARHDPGEAEVLLNRGLELARRQRSSSWVLRCATDLAVLLRHGDRASEGRSMLQSILESFSEGFESADLVAATRVIETLDASRRPAGARYSEARPSGSRRSDHARRLRGTAAAQGKSPKLIPPKTS